MQILEQQIHPLNPRFKVSQRTTQPLTRVAIDMLTVIQVKATDIKPHGNTSVVGQTNQAQKGHKQTRHPIIDPDPTPAKHN